MNKTTADLLKGTIIPVVAIVCLTILGCKWLEVDPAVTKEIYAIACAIGGIGGYVMPRAVVRVKYMIKSKRGGML